MRKPIIPFFVRHFTVSLRPLRTQIPAGSLHVLENCITQDEEKYLINHLNSIFKNKRYQGNHWDDVIYKYKESQISMENIPYEIQKIFLRLIDEIQVKCNKTGTTMLAPHVIDLHKDGSIAPHVDSIKFSGDIVSGLSLLSTRVLRLTPDRYHPRPLDQPQLPNQIDILLRPRSLYILTGPLRYNYAHAILGRNSLSEEIGDGLEESTNPWNEFDRRISIIFRDASVTT